jgi:hypothetical protein
LSTIAISSETSSRMSGAPISSFLDRDLLRDQQQDVGRADLVLLGRLTGHGGEAPLDVAHGLVAEVAHQPAAEARELRVLRHLEPREYVVDGGERILDAPPGGDALPVVLGAGVAAHLDPRARRQPDERVAAEPLAADDRLEQVAVRPVGELEVDGQRGVEIGERLEHHRRAVVARSSEPVELSFGHQSLHEVGQTDEKRARSCRARGRLLGAPAPPAARGGQRLVLGSVIDVAHDFRLFQPISVSNVSLRRATLL